MICKNRKRCCTQSMLLLLAGWFLVAVFVGEIELLTFVPIAVPAIVFALTTLLLLVFWLFRPFREWIEKLDLRYLVGLHLVRFVGIYFLVLHARGQLPAQFALPAGWGDIAVALGALALLLIPNASKARLPVLIWSLAGLLDILYVVKTAAGMIVTHPESLSVMTRLPLSLLPTMIVPLVIFTHIVIFGRLRRESDPAQNHVEQISQSARTETIQNHPSAAKPPTGGAKLPLSQASQQIPAKS